MPALDVNKTQWDGTYEWKSGGEEWSEAWGGSEAQWFGALLPRIHRFIPCKSILEIAPGYGRWTKFLIPNCKRFVGIDLSLKCITACQEAFTSIDYASFYQNDGTSLEAASSENFDFIFSFDSLVHADVEVLAKYIPQIISLLSENGHAFIHHSNYPKSGAKQNLHWRSENVSADVIEHLVGKAGGHIVIQELINWGCEEEEEAIDCMSIFKRADSSPKRILRSIFKRADSSAPKRILNLDFMQQASIIRKFIQPYCDAGSNLP
jgi:SAM-dependent methyltransferase